MKRSLTAIILALVFVPSPVAATTATCKDRYYTCLNNTWDFTPQSVADIYCGAAYAYCLLKSVQ